MNKTHGSRKRDIEMFIKIALFKKDTERVKILCERYKIGEKTLEKLKREVAVYED